MTTYPFSILGALTFIAFALFAALRRIGREPAPYRSLARWHLLFAGVYVAACFGWRQTHSVESAFWTDLFLGLYIYFALQYAFFAHIFGTITQGFSIGIYVALFRLGDGRRIDYVKNERSAVLIKSGALVETTGKLTITPFDRFTANLNRVILKVWTLRYLGVDESVVKSCTLYLRPRLHSQPSS